MILKASERGGANDLATYLLAYKNNDHVGLHSLRGFASDNLRDALMEIEAISQATRCKKFMFSLSVNPPPGEYLADEVFEATIGRIERTLGFEGHPRAIVFHEKNGRKHAHIVWSRIDPDSLTARNMPFFKSRLNSLSKELFLDHGWELPEGYKNRHWKNPMNFTLAEWQQANRIGLDPREVKMVFQEAWAQSDNLKSFRAALEERGYYLARGDRRGHVAVDLNGEVYSVARYAGVKTKDVVARLGAAERLDPVASVIQQNQSRMTSRIKGLLDESRAQQAGQLAPLLKDHRRIVLAQRAERKALKTTQELRRKQETAERQSRFRRGLGGIFDILTGKAMRQRRQNERELAACNHRDQQERETIYRAQMQARALTQAKVNAMRKRHTDERQSVAGQITFLLDLERLDSTRTETRSPRPRGPSL